MKGLSWKKRAMVGFVGVAFAALLTGCGGSEKKSDGKESDTVKIGVNMELTGGVAIYGQSSYNGIKLAVDEINANGGKKRKKVELVVFDTKSEVAEATNGATKLITQDKVKALLGPATSGAALAAQQVATDHKIPMIAVAGTAENVTVDEKGQTRPFIFRAPFIDPFQGTVMATFANKDLKAKTAVIYMDNSSDYSKGLTKAFEETFTKAGGTVVGKEAYLQKDADFKAALTKIKAMNPDVIYVPGYYQEVSLIIKQARELGITAPMMGGDGWDSPKLAEVAGAASLANCFMSNHYSNDDTDPVVQKFAAAYEKKYGAKPEAFAALSYDSMMLLADAMKRAGTTEDTVKIRQALADTKNLQLVTGKFNFDSKNNPIKSAIIVEFKDGKQTFRSRVAPSS